MKILNPNLKKDLKEGRAVKLDLGSGGSCRKGFYSVDHLELKGVDVVADLNKQLDLFPDDCVEYVYSRHTLEHVNELLPLMREIYRITKKKWNNRDNSSTFFKCIRIFRSNSCPFFWFIFDVLFCFC